LQDNGGGGFNLIEQDTVNFIRNVISPAAIAGNMALGLKNAGAVIDDVMSVVQFSVNEQCAAEGECATFVPFITAKKPVFHIEYPSGAGGSNPVKNTELLCETDKEGTDIRAFSTVLSTGDLDGWVQYCNGKVYRTPTS
jgi:hypothetical protein